MALARRVLHSRDLSNSEPFGCSAQGFMAYGVGFRVGARDWRYWFRVGARDWRYCVTGTLHQFVTGGNARNQTAPNLRGTGCGGPQPRQPSNPQLLDVVASPIRAPDIGPNHFSSDRTDKGLLVDRVMLELLQRLNLLIQ